MTAAAESEAAFVAASDTFHQDPAGIVNQYATRAAQARALDPWPQGGEQAQHLVTVGLLLAQAAGIEPGHVLAQLAETYKVEVAPA